MITPKNNLRRCSRKQEFRGNKNLNFSTLYIVYKIPYRRAPRLAPLGRVRRASKGILHTTLYIHNMLF